MLKNLKNALDVAFDKRIKTKLLSDQELAIQIGPIELRINDNCELCMVSGHGKKDWPSLEDSLKA